VQRLGHIVVQTPKYIEALNWYLDTFGMIVSDFSYYPGQARARADLELHPAAIAAPSPPITTPWPWRWVRSSATCTPPTRSQDLDALAAGGEYLRAQGYFRSWGIGPPHRRQPDLRLLA